jgi:hypothetical protein
MTSYQSDFAKANYTDLGYNLYQKNNVLCYVDSSTHSTHCWDIYDIKYFNQFMDMAKYETFVQINSRKFKTKSYFESKEIFLRIQKIFSDYKTNRYNR